MTERTAATTATTLADGRLITTRPLNERDRDALQIFGANLPAEELHYLEDDYQSQEIIARLIAASAAENWRQIVAVDEAGTILGYSAVRRLPGWSSHVADIRLLVSRAARRSGVGRLLAQAIFQAARDLGASKVSVQMIDRQAAGQAIFSQLGFAVEGKLHSHAQGRDGKLYDVIVMSYFVQEG